MEAVATCVLLAAAEQARPPDRLSAAMPAVCRRRPLAASHRTSRKVGA